MSRLLPARHVAGSVSLSSSISHVFVQPTRPAFHGVPRSFSTTITTAHYEQASRKPNEDWEEVERMKQESRAGTAQPDTPIPSRTPRHSLSDARHGPNLRLHEAHHSHVRNNASHTNLRTDKSQVEFQRHNGSASGAFAPPLGLQSTSNEEDAFRLPQRMNRMPPLGTLPRTNNPRIQDHTEDAQSHTKTGDLVGRNEESRSDAVSRGTDAKTGSTAIEQLSIHPDISTSILANTELYGGTPLETNALRCITSGKDVFIRQYADSNPGYILPLMQNLVSSRESRPGSSFVQTASFARHIAKIRPVSVLILCPDRLENARPYYAAKQLLKHIPQLRVESALFGKSWSMNSLQLRILQGCDVLVAHPTNVARLMDEADQRVEIRRKLERLKAVVVVDADLFVKLPCMTALRYVIKELSQRDGDRSRPQGVLVSATDLKGPVKELADALLSPQHEYLREEKPKSKAQSQNRRPKTHAQGYRTSHYHKNNEGRF